jgi:hypothetical protein
VYKDHRNEASLAIYVHIDPTVSAGNTEAAAALKRGLKTKLAKMLTDAVIKGLPSRFSAKLTARPQRKNGNATKKKPATKKTPKNYNAIKMTPQMKLSVEQKGSNLKVAGRIRMDFEAIEWPNARVGSLLASGEKTAAIEDRGSDDKAIMSMAKDVIAAIVSSNTKTTLSSSKFARLLTSLGVGEEP